MKTIRYLGFCVFLCALVAAPAQAAPVTETPEALKLQTQANKTLSFELDEMRASPADRKIYETEVQAQPMAFVSHYEQTLEGPQVTIDKTKFKHFIRFQKALFSQTLKICTLTFTPENCPNCLSAKNRFVSSLRTRLEKRGLAAPLGEEVNEGTDLVGDKAFEYHAARAVEGQCDGVLYIEMVAERGGGEEDVHAKKLRASAYLMLKDSAGRKVKGKGQSTFMVEDTPSADLASSKVIADLFASTAAQTMVATPTLAVQGERYLQLEGVRSFETYSRFKQTVSDAFPEVLLEERVIAPGQFKFLISGDTKLAIADFASKLRTQSWAPQKLEILRTTSQELVVELK